MRYVSEGPVKITKATIDAAWRRRQKGVSVNIRDKDCRGLVLVVSPTTMAWRYSYRPRGIHALTGKRAASRTVTLGNPETHSPETARIEANRLKGQVHGGANPAAEKRAAIAARRAAEAEAAARAAAEAYTFGKLVDDWTAARAGDRRPSYLREAGNCLRRNLPDWKDRPAGSITLVEGVQGLDTIKAEKGTVAANRTQAYARAAYSWAVKRQLLTANPLRGIERPGREAPRERVLTRDELGAIWRACDTLSPVRAAFIRLLLLTLQRREEVVSMRWEELDDPDNPTTWTLPGARAKNGRTHIVHLSESARGILRGLDRVAGNSCVFAGRSVGGSIAAFSSIKVAIDGALGEAECSLPDWRFHDFRRAGVTALASMGFPPHVCDRILNHVTGVIQGVAAVYQRHEFSAERKAALDAWATHVLAAAEGRQPGSNVTPLRSDAA
jgi:integrase